MLIENLSKEKGEMVGRAIVIVASTMLPVIVISVSLGVLALVLAYQRRKDRKHPRHSPLTRAMIRPPGYTLLRKIQESNTDLMAYIAMLFATPLGVFSVHVSQSYFAQQPESVVRISASVITAIVMFVVVGRQTLRTMDERKNLILGYDGETATGEELNQLMLEGCRVFHDVPFPYGNIDHVVVSRSGVFSVNTKCLGKPKNDGNARITVDHDRDLIQFPDRATHIPAEQLVREARWLSKHLSSAVGEAVEVEPMLALPGWFIEKRIGRGSVFVFNPREPQKFFVHKREAISQKLMTQIAHQLEQVCRDVAPQYKEDKSWQA